MKANLTQNTDRALLAAKMFDMLYDNITSFYEYPGEENWTNCHPNATEAEVYGMEVILPIFHKDMARVGCALKECDPNQTGPDADYVIACVYENDTQISNSQLFDKNQFMKMCEGEPKKWRSCVPPLDLNCHHKEHHHPAAGTTPDLNNMMTQPVGNPANPPQPGNGGSGDQNLDPIELLQKKFEEWLDEVQDFQQRQKYNYTNKKAFVSALESSDVIIWAILVMMVMAA